ncbi:MAG TPA: PAS domain-containing protein [Dongiaceae bacterium]|jgi:hypothetical protein|nr:PAS domain-containing protein [Dongiaceae bacterium]
MGLPYHDFRTPEDAKSAKIRELFAYWRKLQRDGHPGPRTGFDPTEVPRLLSSLLLGDIETDPFRVFFRLIGTRVADFSRLDFSGFYLDALDYKGRDSIEWADCYRRVHATGIGLVGFNRVTWEDQQPMEYEFAILPLAREGDPHGSFVALEDYDTIERSAIPDMPPVTIFQRRKE